MKFYKQKSCRLCKLHNTRKQVVVSDGRIQPCDIVFIGEGPGEQEDLVGKPFVGRSGKLLREFIAHQTPWAAGTDIVILNTVSCRPPRNRNPEEDEVAACRNWLRLNLRVIKPKILVCVGKVPSQEFVKGKAERDIVYEGTEIRKAWRGVVEKVYCIYHPAYILRNNTRYYRNIYAKSFKKLTSLI